MRAQRALTLLEAVISLAFVGIIMLSVLTVVRTISVDTAEISLANELEMSALRISTLIADELRLASAETVKLGPADADADDANDNDPVFGPKLAEFQLVADVDVVTGDVWLSEVIRYHFLADGKFQRIADGITQGVGYFAAQGDGSALGPGLTFTLLNPQTIEFTVRVEAINGVGVPIRRERTVTVSMAND